MLWTATRRALLQQQQKQAVRRMGGGGDRCVLCVCVWASVAFLSCFLVFSPSRYDIIGVDSKPFGGTPQPYHEMGAEIIGVICWVWVFHRARHDGPVLLGWKHPWEH